MDEIEITLPWNVCLRALLDKVRQEVEPVKVGEIYGIAIYAAHCVPDNLVFMGSTPENLIVLDLGKPTDERG